MNNRRIGQLPITEKMKFINKTKSVSSSISVNSTTDLNTETFFDSMARSIAGSTSRRSIFKAVFTGMGGIVLGKLGIKSAFAASNCLCNGRVYDSDTACCISSAIVQKNPIANLASCPNKVKNSTHVCKPNGCGGEGGTQPPQSYFAANFIPACREHDCCYDTCNANKAQCDRVFRESLIAVCNLTYPGSSITQRIKRGGCTSTAEVYYQFVDRKGQEYYDQAQRISCDCCGTETCKSCAGGSCGGLPVCAGGGDCRCFTTPQGSGVCIHGNTPCAGLKTCGSNADCPPGYGCAATSCCGGSAVCGPLCSDVTSASFEINSTSAVRAMKVSGERTMGGDLYKNTTHKI